MKIVVTTGYFNPLHSKHVDYLNKAKQFGDHLIVIINNDSQVKLKKSIEFHNQEERIKIVSNLKCVDEVILCIDSDSTVSETLKYIYNKYKHCDLIFVKSGDRNKYNTIEFPLLIQLGYKCYWDIIEYDDSISSSIIKNNIKNENKNI